jgi:hypothetical protein
MALSVNVNNKFSLQEVSNVIRSALTMDEQISKHKKAKYAKICKNFEDKFEMSSDVFMKKFEMGELDDRDDFFDWFAAKKGFDKWSKKLDILSGISL